MKSVTEFWTATLNKGIKAKEELTAAGKTAEEVLAGIGELMKYEGDKLKHFVNAVEVAIANPENLSRVQVVQLTEGEKVPAKATKIEEHTYVPDFKKAALAVNTTKRDPKAQGGPKKDGNRPKTSPWGLTPEEKAAKKGGGKAAAKPAAE